MFCTSCGAQVADDASFCPVCGTPLAPSSAAPAAAPASTAPASASAPAGGASASWQQTPAQQPAYQQPAYQQPAPQSTYQQPPAYPSAQNPWGAVQPSMKWYKFIIWVQLFLMALFSFANAVLLFSGGHYQGEADLVYSVFPDLKPIDTVFAIPFLALGAFCIVVRQELASFKRQGPSHYYILYGAAIAVQLLYIIVASGVLGDLAADAGTWTGITMSVVMIIANKVYFDKRAFLFRN